MSNLKVSIVENGQEYALPYSGRSTELRLYLNNHVPVIKEYEFYKPRKTELWYAHPFFGKTSLSYVPWIKDGDCFADALKKPVVVFSNDLSVYNYHFYWYLSDEVLLDRLDKCPSKYRVNAIHRIRLVDLGYGLLPSIFKHIGRSEVHLIYCYEGFTLSYNKDSDIILATNIKWIDIKRVDDKLILCPRR